MDAISGLFRSVIWNETIPDRLRGRLAGVEMISYTAGPTLGNFEAGAVASFAGVRDVDRLGRRDVRRRDRRRARADAVLLALRRAPKGADVTLPLAHATWFETGHRSLD